MVIDWKKFEGKYIDFEEGRPKKLLLAEWKESEQKFGNNTKPSVEFTVLEEDGVQCSVPKTWNLSNWSALEKLRPMVEKAEASGVKVISVLVTRMGSGRDTTYGVVEASLL